VLILNDKRGKIYGKNLIEKKMIFESLNKNIGVYLYSSIVNFNLIIMNVN